MDNMRLGKLLGKSRFVVKIALAAVVRNQRELMVFREPPQDVEGANFAASIDREELACLDPQHSHSIFPRRVDLDDITVSARQMAPRHLAAYHGFSAERSS
jgi:hypothetical protein